MARKNKDNGQLELIDAPAPVPAKMKAKDQPAPTTAQQLGSIVKSARDIMRKDKGLNGDLDRLPMLTWIMFLKFLDDMEQIRETEAALRGEKFRPAIDPPYRWRDWAAKETGVTGPELISFVNNDEAMRPDGKKGVGLFAYLRGLQGAAGGDRRDVIATVFKGTINRMINGYLLRDVINKINGIHFNSTEEIHTLGRLYESMLREMRDAAGDSGEFYTPRPVVRFMVEVTDPRLGEVVLDPACGTGGFLTESFEHLQKQCKTAQHRIMLQQKSLLGGEAKPLPFLLAQMNLLLHGLESPRISPGNSLDVKLSELGDKDRVDVILTNPPFGGEEERGIQNNFPGDKQTSETALLFLQLIMRKLRRGPKPGRAGVVVPNGTLYADGVAARIRQELISEFNLHTVVRLPKGVFEPYADIPTNILFFDRQSPTQKVWFYKHPLPVHRAGMRSPSYSQTDPLQSEEFEPLLKWWCNRKEDDHAWSVSVADIARHNYSLDLRHPRVREGDFTELPMVIERVKVARATIAEASEKLRNGMRTVALLPSTGLSGPVSQKRLADVCDIIKGTFPTMKTPVGSYPFIVTAATPRTADAYQLDGEAVCIPLVSSTGHGHAALHRIHFASGQFALANIMAALVVKPGITLLSKYLYYYLWRFKEQKLVTLMKGTANTSLTVAKLASVVIDIPRPDDQRKVVQELDVVMSEASSLGAALRDASVAIDDAKELSLLAAFDNVSGGL